MQERIAWQWQKQLALSVRQKKMSISTSRKLWERRTTKPKNRPRIVDATAPQTGELPQNGPSGFRFRRLSKKRHTENATAAPSGSVGSAAADCHPALQHDLKVVRVRVELRNTGKSTTNLV